MGQTTGLIIAGGIGFLSALGMEWIRRLWSLKQRKKRTKRLAVLLYEEVEQVAELLDVDLAILDSEELDFILGFGRDDKYFHQINDAILRLEQNRTIFDAYATELLELPGYLPNSLVRFFNRMKANCGRMKAGLEDGDLKRLRALRVISNEEAELIKFDLRQVFTGIGSKKSKIIND